MQPINSNIEQAFEKNDKIFHKNRAKEDNNKQLKGPLFYVKFLTWGENTFFCKTVLLYTINNPSVVMEIIISKFSYSLKIRSGNTFPEPQPDSASYAVSLQIAHFSTSQVNYQQAVMVQNWLLGSLMFFFLFRCFVWSLLCFLYFDVLKKGHCNSEFNY